MKKTTNFAESPGVPVYERHRMDRSSWIRPGPEYTINGEGNSTPPLGKIDWGEPVELVSAINYKFNERELIEELQEYIDTTYDGHYSADGGLQATDLIMAAGRGQDFCVGNILKYAHRYEKKGTAADARKDLMKVLHYGIMAIYAHDKKYIPNIGNKEEDKRSS
jgi:hypothetical protein